MMSGVYLKTMLMPEQFHVLKLDLEALMLDSILNPQVAGLLPVTAPTFMVLMLFPAVTAIVMVVLANSHTTPIFGRLLRME